MRRMMRCSFFFFNDTATTEIYTLSLHDALPICEARDCSLAGRQGVALDLHVEEVLHREPDYREKEQPYAHLRGDIGPRSEEHTSELQSRQYLVCRLLLEKKTIN